MEQSNDKQDSSPKKFNWQPLLLVVLFVVIVLGGYFLYKNDKTNSTTNNVSSTNSTTTTSNSGTSEKTTTANAKSAAQTPSGPNIDQSLSTIDKDLGNASSSAATANNAPPDTDTVP